MRYEERGATNLSSRSKNLNFQLKMLQASACPLIL